MKSIFKEGDKKTYTRTVQPADVAAFDSGQVHPVYATFAIARDAEWAGRLFVLDMKEDHEEGIGTYINVAHKSPALTGEEVTFEATVKSIRGNEVICTFTAACRGRLIAEGETGQKILLKEKLEKIFGALTA